MKRKIVAGFIAILCLIALPAFLEHYLALMTGRVKNLVIIQRRWDLVALSIIGFLLFLIPLRYRHKTDWSSFGIYTAFIVSLFVEMYGIPLTLYLTSGLGSTTQTPAYIFEFTALGIYFGLNLWMLIGLGITALGAFIVSIGWYQLYTSEEKLVTSGVYAYSRHPQYIGISLIVIGWFIGWPTLLTTLMLPILLFVYYRAALKEEEEVKKEVEGYEEYMNEVPRFI
ncbi:MAG: DUF1295 domain-containing protein [Nanohaloarchaea archaeon]|nr:DUF1295 domain-containing protein [Candidatus Nanohaloarchaea archaeon]